MTKNRQKTGIRLKESVKLQREVQQISARLRGDDVEIPVYVGRTPGADIGDEESYQITHRGSSNTFTSFLCRTPLETVGENQSVRNAERQFCQNS